MASESEPSPFDFTADMRLLAERSVAQARETFELFVTAAQRAVDSVETQAAGAQAGAKEVGEFAIGFAERNIANSFEFVQKLLQAKEPKDVVALHTEYVNAQIALLSAQAKELCRRAAKMVGQGSH